jgi:hypothetical protein
MEGMPAAGLDVHDDPRKTHRIAAIDPDNEAGDFPHFELPVNMGAMLRAGVLLFPYGFENGKKGGSRPAASTA